MRIIISFLFSALIYCASLSGQVISFSNKVDSIYQQMSFWDKIHQLYPFDVMNTGDNPRINLAGFYMADGPHGYRYPESTGVYDIDSFDSIPDHGKATSFPVSVAIAATWDTDLAFLMAKTMAKEFAARGINQILAPSLYLCNEPRNGRSAESYGEDPFLASKIAVATVNAMQSVPAIATVKAFIGENAQDTRMTDSITIGKRMLMEHWGLPFKHSIQDANALSVMSAYVSLNDLNNPGAFFYSSENYSYNTEVLRHHWGFPYYMVSDWGAVHDAELALKSGLDVCMGNWLYATDLWQPIVSGLLPYSYLETSVKRVLKTKMASGITTWQPSVPESFVGGAESEAMCYEAGIKSLVLLKNEENILPLNNDSITYIAVIGPSAAVPQLDGYGSSFVFPTSFITVIEGILDKVGPSKLLYTKGCDINSEDTSGFDYALTIASWADVVVFVGGLDHTMEGEGYDRITGSTDLPGVQQQLINELAAVNPNLVAVIMSGGIVNLNNCLHNIKGLLYGFYPGQFQGAAIADVLFGDYNPGGKLPVTMPANDSQLPPRNNDFNDDWGGGYRWFDIQMHTPAFAFGHGLSYTSFNYNSINIQNNSVNYGDDVHITVNLTNTGDRYGEEVVQLYVTHPESALPMPEKQLKGFNRIGLNSGESADVSFMITPQHLYYFDEETDSYDVMPGDYTIRAGGASDNLPLSASFSIQSATAKPDLEPSGLFSYPPFPQVGDTVIFYANIKNRGVADINNQLITAEIKVENQLVSKISANHSIIKGGMIQSEALVPINGKNFWIAEAPGDYNISINVDYNNSIAECNEDNNFFSRILTVYDTIIDPMEVNLAWRKPIIASSVSDTINYRAEWAVDGFRNSKWMSAGNNNEFIQIDLLNNYSLNKIAINWYSIWNDCYALDYNLLVSVDTINWVLLHDISGANGENVEFDIDIIARFIRIEMDNPYNGINFGIYEVKAFGTPLTCEQQICNLKTNVFPNPCKIGHSFTVLNTEPVKTVRTFDVFGELISTEQLRLNKSGIIELIAPQQSGVYFIEMITVDDLKVVKKLIVYDLPITQFDTK